MVPYYINYQTISSPNLWSFNFGKRGPVAVVYKLPVIPCLVHSQPAVHASYHRSGLRLGHTRWTAAESDQRFLSFFFLFPDDFYEICCSTLFSALFWHGLDVRPPFMSALIVPRELVRQPGFGRWQKGMCSIPREHTLANSHTVREGMWSSPLGEVSDKACAR